MIGRSLSQRYAERAARSVGVRARCSACGETSHGIGVPGSVTPLMVDHDARCEFFLAVERDEGHAWIDEHGYPIVYDIVTGGGDA